MFGGDLESLRLRYEAERPGYVELAEEVACRLRTATRQRGLICDVEGRAKEMLPATLSAHAPATFLEAEPAGLVAQGGARAIGRPTTISPG